MMHSRPFSEIGHCKTFYIVDYHLLKHPNFPSFTFCSLEVLLPVVSREHSSVYLKVHSTPAESLFPAGKPLISAGIGNRSVCITSETTVPKHTTLPAWGFLHLLHACTCRSHFSSHLSPVYSPSFNRSCVLN
ncbi:hypothetical protein CHARACLAT_009313 [Characodon lateralis]|uniref:Uncharacterized protein n=1 Tax=Characodon lateralis TaxID=208331 RepID=A0ABU7EI78_9TELE|nr:hypothetical protein [Characodon lateralis]